MPRGGIDCFGTYPLSRGRSEAMTVGLMPSGTPDDLRIDRLLIQPLLNTPGCLSINRRPGTGRDLKLVDGLPVCRKNRNDLGRRFAKSAEHAVPVAMRTWSAAFALRLTGAPVGQRPGSGECPAARAPPT